MASLINQPPSSAVQGLDPLDGNPAVRIEWRNFFQAAYVICNALTQSGTTAQRPVKLLWTGRIFFDTTLGLPIFYKTAGWVKADGTAA